MYHLWFSFFQGNLLVREIILGTGLGKVCSCCAVSLLPQLACNFLAIMYKYRAIRAFFLSQPMQTYNLSVSAV